MMTKMMSKLTEKQISMLEEKGATRWTKYGKDRLYFDKEMLGFKMEFYKSGNLSCASFDGEPISNADCGRVDTPWINLMTGELNYGGSYSRISWMLDKMNERIEAMVAEVSKPAIDKSSIMKAAWKMIREQGMTRSEAMKEAWRQAKEAVKAAA